MKAVRIHQFGDVNVLTQDDVEIPRIQDDEVLIRVIATSINPIDCRTRDGFLKEILPRPLPLTLGWDVAGIIQQIGDNVDKFKGDENVYALADITRDGACSEYIAVKANLVAPKPKTISFTAAASLPLAGTTAWQAVIDIANIQHGQRILIHGAAGGVGSIAVQLAKWKGAYVIATTSKAKLDFVYSLGANEVIDYETTRFDDVVKDMDAVIDPIGGDIQNRSYRVLKPGGILVSLLQPVDEEQMTAFQVRGKFFWVQPSAETLVQLARVVDQGHVRPIIDREYGIDAITQAHKALESRQIKGKVVVQVAIP